ncbi:Lrp/AsnC family transcriptional regulator [Streptomyces barringtoniae]|uniref:Lrp/AsnC family transcriptional regulator n=1 Tax=Streptomyces barringtoniae TaxID=2892029 RepID=UPI001E55FCFE|nr:Lrp/AsnC family transcriptional regulator [Streptomyces barringtoniae]MCC5478367.1 Lrp/AsnC family transcriptional regulator [Streptomyces barringtoniae]
MRWRSECLYGAAVQDCSTIRPLCCISCHALYDRIDRAILDHLTRHGRTPNVDGYRADLYRERLDLGLTVFLSLEVEHYRTTCQLGEEALKAIDHVVACHVVSGDADFFVELAVPDRRTFEKVLTGPILAIGPVRDARSTFCIRTVIDRGPLPLISRSAPRA